MAKNSLQLRRELSVSEFYRFSKSLATAYAQSAASVARTAMMDKFNVTESTYYTLLETAVSHNLVNDAQVQQITEKILANQKAHENGGHRSVVKYNRLKEERKNYTAYSKKDIQEIAEYFAYHPERSKKEIAEHFSFYRVQVLDQILRIACEELIITDKVFNVMRERSIKTAVNRKATEVFFDKLAATRAEVKRKKKGQPNF